MTDKNKDGFPLYKRPNNGKSVRKMVSGSTIDVDNSFVLPYNQFLLKYFKCHINVELCISVSGVKYIYKYINKGHEQSNIMIVQETNTLECDEVASYLKTR